MTTRPLLPMMLSMTSMIKMTYGVLALAAQLGFALPTAIVSERLLPEINLAHHMTIVHVFESAEAQRVVPSDLTYRVDKRMAQTISKGLRC